MTTSIKKPILFQNNRCPLPMAPSVSSEEMQEQLSGNGIGCTQLLRCRGLWHYSQLAVLWHLLLKLWFKAIIGEILAMFR